MPSPYFWEVLHDFERRVSLVQRDVEAVRARLAIAEEAERVRRSMTGEVGGARRMLGDETSLLLSSGTDGGNDFNAMASLILYEGGGGGPAASLPQRLASLARSQSDLFLRIAARAAHAHEGLEDMKLRYQRYCQATRGGGYYEDPFLKADVEEVSREREMQRMIMEEQLATTTASTIAQGSAAQPAASTGGLFGQPAQAPSAGGLFGAPVPAAPAPGKKM